MTREDFLRSERRNEDVVVYRRWMVDVAGDLNAGILLGRLVYWHGIDEYGNSRLRVTKYDPGTGQNELWCVKSAKDWWDECRMSAVQARRAVKILEAKGLIVTAKHRFNGAPTTHHRIVWDALLKAIEEHDARVNVTVEVGSEIPYPEQEARFEGNIQNDLHETYKSEMHETYKSLTGALRGSSRGESPHQIEEQRSEESEPSPESGPDLEGSPSSPPLENWLSVLEKVSYSESELSELRKRGARDYCAVKRFVADYKGDRPRLSTYFKQHEEWIDKSSVDYTHYREAIEANERDARREAYREMGLNDFAAECALDMDDEELQEFLRERGVA